MTNSLIKKTIGLIAATLFFLFHVSAISQSFNSASNGITSTSHEYMPWANDMDEFGREFMDSAPNPVYENVSAVAYISDTTQPWGKQSNIIGLDHVYPNQWTHYFYNTVVASEVFVPQRLVVFIEGGDLDTFLMRDFLMLNNQLIEDWVTSGGKLLISAASNPNGIYNLGFGIQSIKDSGTIKSFGWPVNVNNQFFTDSPYSPIIPNNIAYRGRFFSHNYLSGPDLEPLIRDDASRITLGQKPVGSGLVRFSGMATPFFIDDPLAFWQPKPEIWNLLYRTIYFDIIPPSAICQDITVELDASGSANITTTDIDNGSSDDSGSVLTEINGVVSGSLSTTFAGGNGGSDGGAVYFDVAVTADLSVESLQMHIQDFGIFTVEVYAIEGDTYVGNETNPGAWTLVSTGTGLSNGTGRPSDVTLDTALSLTNGTTYAMALVLDATHSHRYTNGDGTNQNYSDTNLSISSGAASNQAFTDTPANGDLPGIFSPRVFNGSLVYKGSINFTCADLGVNTVTLTVTDPSGNSSTCTATVTVEDNIAPTAVGQDITVNLDATGNATITTGDIDNGSSDNCGTPTLGLDVTSFGCADVGPNTVTLTANDGSGNSDSTTATVTVVDNIAPTAVCQDITIQLDAAGNASIVAGDIDNGSSDNCSVSLSADVTSFTAADLGANTVTLTVTDSSGNTAVCTATVTVEDNIAPTAVCQDLTVQMDATGNATITAAGIDNGSSDNDSVASLSLDITAFTCADLGANTVNLTVTDPSGNSSTCTATVTVQDNLEPTAIGQDITVNLDATGNATITTGDIDNGSSDNCGIVNQTLDITAFTCADLGPNALVYTVEDSSSNQDGVTVTVTVVDSIDPTVITQNITVQLDATGNATITTADIDNGTSDNCTIVSLTLDVSSFTCADVGTNTVTLTAEDESGNTGSATASVTVEDNITPSVLTQDITVDLDAMGTASITPGDIDNGSNDNCSIDTYSLDIDTFDCDDVGANTVTLTVVDVNGNSSQTTAVVTVVNPTPTSAPLSGGDQSECALSPLQTLTATANVNAGETLFWYDAATGGNVVADPSLNALGSITYYAEAVNDLSSCVSLSRTAVTLEILALPTPTITNNTGIGLLDCNLTTISLTASGGDSYLWSTGETTATIDVTTPDTYSVTVTGTNGCSDVTSIVITQDITLPIPEITNNTGVTQLDCNVTLINLTASGGDSYLWSTGETTASINVTTPDTYSVTVTGTNGCSDETSLSITQDINQTDPPVSAGDQSECELFPIQTLTASATVGAGQTLVWYDAATGGNIVADPSLNTVGTVTYYATAIDNLNGCESVFREPVTLEIIEAPEAPISGGDITEVAQNPVQTITATATVNTGEILSWFDASVGGNIISDPSLSSPGTVTYYAETFDPVIGCDSAVRTSVTLTLTATCDDGVRNGDETGIDCGGSSCLECAPETILHEGYFETSWDGWIDGGIDCERVFGPEAYEGDYSIRLRADTGLESSMILENIDIDSFNWVIVDFHFYTKNFSHGERFIIEYTDDYFYYTVAEYVKGQDFENEQFYNKSLLMLRYYHEFSQSASWRIRATTNSQNDQVFIDQVTITGNPEAVFLSGTSELAILPNLSLVPNPAKDYISIKTSLEGDLNYTIYNFLGQVINKGIYNGIEIPVYDLSTGLYFLEINNGIQKSHRKFIKE